MALTIEEERFLLQRKQEIEREIRELESQATEPHYHDLNERRIELGDELNEVEGELRRQRVQS